MEAQTNNPIMYPSRIYNGSDFVVNAGREQSSDKLTTVMTDKNEVLGFEDGTSQQEMEHAINADRNGSISEYKPTFYDKFIRQPLAAIGMDAFQPKFISDIEPTPERAFATSMARAATADILKPSQSDKEAQAYPVQAFAGGLVGSVAAFATGGALLDGFKFSQLTPFAENIIKGGVLGGAYKGVSETSNELRDEEHPDLAKIGQGVLHDAMWWGGISGVVGSVAKPVGVASAAGLGYLMAKSDGADEPSSLLNGAVLGGFHLLNSHGDQPEVRQFVTEKLQSSVADYILVKNPAVHPIVADQAGREFVANHAQDVIEQSEEPISNVSNPIDEVIKSPELTAKLMQNISKQVMQEGAKNESEGEGQAQTSDDIRDEGTKSKEEINPLYEEARKYKTADEFINEQKNLSPKEYVNKRVGDFEGELVVNRGLGTIEINTINLEKKGQGTGTKIIEALKEYANLKDQRLSVPKPYNQKFWEKQEFIEKNDGSMVYDAKISFKPKLTSIWNEAHQSEEVNISEEGTGPEKTSGLSQSVETSAIKEGLVKDLGELPSYKQRDMGEIAERVSEFINKDYELAKKIALGEAPEQDGLRQPELFTGIRLKAEAEGDIETIRDLALSKKASALATEAGQRVQALNAENSDSAVEAIREVQKVRQEVGKSKKVDKEKGAIIKDIKSEIKKNVPTKETWASFIESIQC